MVEVVQYYYEKEMSKSVISVPIVDEKDPLLWWLLPRDVIKVLSNFDIDEMSIELFNKIKLEDHLQLSKLILIPLDYAIEV